MEHYVAIENHSGYVWGEADAEGAAEAVRKILQDVDPGCLYTNDRHSRPLDIVEVSETEMRGTDQSGFHVYLAPEGWKRVNDGQDQEEIERVEALPYVAAIDLRKPAIDDEPIL